MIVLLSTFYDIVFLLIIIFIFVCWILLQIIILFKQDVKLNSYSTIYYGRGRSNHLFLEFIWTILPILVFFLIFIPVFKLVRVIDTTSNLSFEKLENVEISSGTTIKIIGNQWYWLYEYDDLLLASDNYLLAFDMDEFVYSYMLGLDYNNDTDNILISNFIDDCSLRLLSTDFSAVLSKEVPIRFIITSYDVIHSWCLPSSGIKIDATPGRITSFKSVFKCSGFYYGQCSELCGFLHGFMPISVKIV